MSSNRSLAGAVLRPVIAVSLLCVAFYAGVEWDMRKWEETLMARAVAEPVAIEWHSPRVEDFPPPERPFWLCGDQSCALAPSWTRPK